MKNFKLLLATAIVFAVGSAFTSVKDAPSGAYVKIGSTYVPVAGRDGQCELGGDFCSYNKIGNAGQGTPSEFTNPANFQGVEAGQHWQE